VNYDSYYQLTREMLEKSSTKSKTFYKVYSAGEYNNQHGKGISLKGLYFGKKKLIRKPGWIISNRENKNLSEREAIELKTLKGIHVFEDEQGAKLFRDRQYPFCEVVPVECYLKDLVMSGMFSNRSCSVFMKVRILSKTWKKLEKDYSR
jgi:hypothetical protein